MMKVTLGRLMPTCKVSHMRYLTSTTNASQSTIKNEPIKDQDRIKALLDTLSLGQHGVKFKSWEQLIQSDSRRLKELGLKVKERKLLLASTHFIRVAKAKGLLH